MLKETFLIPILVAMGCTLIAPTTAEAPVSDIPSSDVLRTEGPPMDDGSEWKEIIPEFCGTDFAYHSGNMVDDNAPAITAKECQAQCAALSTCNFWDFGEGFCRLRSNKGPKGKIEHWGYSFGTKNCRVDLDADQTCDNSYECEPGFECMFDEGATIKTCTRMYGDKGQPCGYGIEGEFFGECRPELECKYEGPVGLCSTIDDAGTTEAQKCGIDLADYTIMHCKPGFECMYEDPNNIDQGICMTSECAGNFSCFDGFCMDGYTAEEINKWFPEENFFSRNQICDGNIACPATKFDEMGCDLANGDKDDEDTSNPGSNPEQ